MPYTRCTAEGHDHRHVAYVDPRTGNGRADPVPEGDGHMHEIIAWIVLPGGADSHAHDLVCPPDQGHG